MAKLIGMSTTLRSSRATAILDKIDAQSSAGKVKFYDGSRPATGGTATNLLGTLSLGTTAGTKPSGSVTNGVLTVNTNGSTGATASGTGTTTWARVTDGSDNFVMDLNVGTTNADIVLDNTSFVTGQKFTVTTGGTITEGNA